MAAKVMNEIIGELAIDKLLADPRDHYVTTDELIASDAELKRGQLVEYDATTKTVKALASGDIFGIVAKDVSGADGDISVPVYVRGSFNFDAVAEANSDVTLDDKYAACRNVGLILRRPEDAQE